MIPTIGFLVLIVVGLLLIAYGLLCARVSTAFGGSLDWWSFILFCGAGAACVYRAMQTSPFAIVWRAVS